MCVICQSSFTIGVLTVCGHQFCKECITFWFRAHHNCPVCKRHLNQSNLHDITFKPQELKVHSEGNNEHPNQSQTTPSKKISTIYSEFNPEKLAEIKNIDLQGPNFTTKVDTLVRHLLWLRESDPGAKSIVFSQYKEFLDVLAQAFRRYRIGHASFDNANGVTQFKEDPGTEVFLLHARAHASGLNLVNASHVFLCEPLLNTALELQAIARVDRIGQQQETTVWLYIVDGTVEESIYQLSVQRRMEHMGRSILKGKSKESTPELLDANLDAANALEMQQAHLSRLMGKDGISGEVVDKKDLWTCLFGHGQTREGCGEQRLVSNPVTRGFLAAEAAEERRVQQGS
jgi:E3 ubiquitin-protein ligase SHPRH